MKKMKKILAMVLAMAMVLGMSLTVAAEGETANITINGIETGEEVTFNYVRIIEPDVTAKTGWKFTSDIVKGFYVTAFTTQGQPAPTDQDVIASLIDIEKANQAETSTKLAAALNAIKANGTLANLNVVDKDENSLVKTVQNTNVLPVDGAGVYYIEGNQTGYLYNPMTAYIKFSAYDTTTGVPADLDDEEISAKRIKNVIVKSSSVNDGVTEIKDTVDYTIESTIPFLPLTDTNRHYELIDNIHGASYVTEKHTFDTDEGEVDAVKLTVTYGENYGESLIVWGRLTSSTSFTADLSSLLTDAQNNATNTNANRPLKVQYSATVTGVQVGNDAFMGDGTPDGKDKFGSSEGQNELYTGWIQVTKYASDDNNDDFTDNALLENAGFAIYKTENNVPKYASFKTENGKTLFDGWKDAEDETTVVYTDEKGVLKVEGFEEGTYSIVERVAPEGYSINEEIKSVELKAEKGQDEKATAVFGNDVTKVFDSKLSALPSTGGIGTTIFTIGGVAIMVVAAGLFFATRKKSTK